jgi:hypothetical protein
VPAAEDSAFHSETLSLVVGEPHTPGTDLFAQDAVFFQRRVISQYADNSAIVWRDESNRQARF